MRDFAVAGLLSLSLVLSLAAPVMAQTVIYVDATATGDDTGASWTHAYADLQDALAAATSGDEIWVAAGTYKPTDTADRAISFTLVEGVALYGGFAGTETLRAERDWTVHETILSGDLNGDDVGFTNNGENSYHVLVGASDATLDGFTITGGNADALTPDNRGAGMHNDGVTGVTIANCTFAANAGGYLGGGAIYNGPGTALSIYTCAFEGNIAVDGMGGAIFNDRVAGLLITNCTFSDNSVPYGGGAMYCHRTEMAIMGCTFSRNRADDWGGAINLDRCSTEFIGSNPEITNCVFWDNHVTDYAYGGAIENTGPSSPVITNCTFAYNTGGGSGGAIHNYSDSAPTLTNCILWGASSPAGQEIISSGGASCTVSYSDVGQTGGFTDVGGNIDSDPLFIDAPSGDLGLRPGSPCIDAADGDVAPATDIEGNPRNDDDPETPNTGAGTPPCVDMGAYEFQTGNPWTPAVTPFAGGCLALAPSPLPLALLALAACFVLARRLGRA